MTFETHILPPNLAPFLESIFHFKDFMPDHEIERVVPTGHIFIIFELDGMPRHTVDNKSLKPKETFTKVWISGMHRNYISISARPMSEMFVIQFKAFGAYPFLHVPIQTLNEKVLPAEQVFGAEIFALRDDLLKGITASDKFDVAEKWLKTKFDPQKVPGEEFLSILRQLESGSATTYQEVIDRYPRTHKHLIDQFKKYVGLTPKYYQRILRFNEILRKIQQKEDIAWAQVAYRSGFSDQSHFIKEFKHFSGFNPESFIRQAFHQQEPNFFPLDREG